MVAKHSTKEIVMSPTMMETCQLVHTGTNEQILARFRGLSRVVREFNRLGIIPAPADLVSSVAALEGVCKDRGLL